jgi:hypothetical protein
MWLAWQEFTEADVANLGYFYSPRFAGEGEQTSNFAPSPALARRAASLRVHDFAVVPRQSGAGNLEPAIVALPRETHAFEPPQAWPILQSRRPAGGPAQHQPVQSRAAASLEIRLIPHASNVGYSDAERNNRAE